MDMDWISIISIALLVASCYITFKKKGEVATPTISNNTPQETSSNIVYEDMPGDYERNKMETKDKSMATQEKEITIDDEPCPISFDLKQAMIINEILNRPSF